MPDLILASGSEIRASLLENAGLDIEVRPGRVDEDGIRLSLAAEGAPPRDVADALAEMKALKVSRQRPEALVLGCDQILEHRGDCLSKPLDPTEAKDQLRRLRGDQHALLSAAVVCQAGQPLWRHIGVARLKMRSFSDDYLEFYVDRHWESIRHSVGGYKLEEEGVRLMSQIDGDYFTILGLPLMELLGWLTVRGDIEG